MDELDLTEVEREICRLPDVSIVRLVAYAAAFFVVAMAPLPGRRSLFYWSILLSGAIAAALSWWHRLEGWDTRLFGEFMKMIDETKG